MEEQGGKGDVDVWESEIDVPAVKGVTPLGQAFSVANEGMVQILIEAGPRSIWTL